MRISIAIIASIVAATPALASGFQDLASIDSSVARFTGAAIGQAGGAQAPVDRQMRLAQCRDPLLLEWYGTSQTAVRVSCPESWRIFVPVMQARAQPAAEVEAAAISRRDLLRVEAGGAGFRVTRQGEALEDGRVGQAIRVKLDDGSRQGRVVSAQVIEAGRVRVLIH